jgi:hypothetical protein
MVARSIDSVLAQEFQPFEIVVVDDGSTDNTREILSAYKNRIISIYQPNAGFAAARTRGIQETSSSLVAFHDSDDVMLPCRLEAQVAFMREHPEVAALSGNAVIQGMESVDYLENCGIQFGKEGWVIVERGFQKLLSRNFMVDPASIIRRECFLEVGGYDLSLRSSADWDLWLRMSRKWPLACIKMPCVWVRKHERNLSSSPVEIACNIRIMDKALRCGEPLDQHALEAILKRLYGQIRCYVIQNLTGPSEPDWGIKAKRCAEHLPCHQRLLVGLTTMLPRKLSGPVLRKVVKTRAAFRKKFNNGTSSLFRE